MDTELDAEDLKDVSQEIKAFYKSLRSEDFPTEPKIQLIEAVKAVFRSWDNPRANVYCRMNEIPYAGVPQSVYSPWYSVTPVTNPAQVLHLPVTLQPAKRHCLVNTSLTHRVKTLLLVSYSLPISHLKRICRKSTSNLRYCY